MVRRETRAQKRHHKIMKTIKEVRDWLIANRTDVSGDLNLSGLDFSDFDGMVSISNMKVKTTLFQSHQEVKGNLFQDYQEVKGNLYQDNQEVKGTIYQDEAKE